MSCCGGQNADLVALADVPVLAVLTAGEDYTRVVLALDEAISTGVMRPSAIWPLRWRALPLPACAGASS